jgi:hypothetical protein
VAKHNHPEPLIRLINSHNAVIRVEIEGDHIDMTVITPSVHGDEDFHIPPESALAHMHEAEVRALIAVLQEFLNKPATVGLKAISKDQH